MLTDDDLPNLPPLTRTPCWAGYTADDMREYGRLAQVTLASSSAAREDAMLQSTKGTLLRAADMLAAYGELIRRDGATHVEEHHYIPDVEWVASELRDAAIQDAARSATKGDKAA